MQSTVHAVNGDILHAIIDQNGFSVTVDSLDVAKAVLSGDAGTELALLVSPSKEPTQLRVVKIKRIHPLRTK